MSFFSIWCVELYAHLKKKKMFRMKENDLNGPNACGAGDLILMHCCSVFYAKRLSECAETWRTGCERREGYTNQLVRFWAPCAFLSQSESA